MEYEVIIPAAGSGTRMGAGKNKLFIELNGRPIILHTLDVFAADRDCSKMIAVIQPKEEKIFKEMTAGREYEGKLEFVYGGAERQHSVYNGLTAVSGEIVLVHDGARPFIRRPVIRQLVREAARSGAAIAAVPVKDTIKKAVRQEVVETIDRSSLWQIQTPQAFRLSILQKAHEWAKAEDYLGTDEASLVEKMGDIPVKIIESDYDNMKITTPEDLYFARAVLEKRTHLNG
ncbi:2-C-methyl-D-erythritol 4-phosphate cytidylyltransferase [Siminovitchia sp. 179-K 8D1 HS]|uniref:2-C-methyl-D-erythritol 4-phosphate cytidylyltransferase n=1 Tax=Siminovitchia sp. 179-K 8D1 HS TaxID=3142385 RepID=UPI00399FADC4